jgi:hypothetical protein
MNREHVLDVLAILTPAFIVLAAQLEGSGWAVQWPTVVAAVIGGVVAWSRTATGGFRKEQ